LCSLLDFFAELHQIKTSHMSPKFLYYSLLFPILFLGCHIRFNRWHTRRTCFNDRLSTLQNRDRSKL